MSRRGSIGNSLGTTEEKGGREDRVEAVIRVLVLH